MNRKAQALLLDIVSLLSKHDIDAFELLSQEMESSDFVNHLAHILKQITEQRELLVARQSQSTSRRRNGRPIQVILEKMADEDPEKGRLLRSFRDKLVAGSYLPTLRDVRDFVDDCGLPPMKDSSRERAISTLIRALSDLPLDRVRSLLHAATQTQYPRDRSLAGWSELILEGRDRSLDTESDHGAPVATSASRQTHHETSDTAIRRILHVPDWLLGNWRSHRGPSLRAEHDNIAIYVEKLGASSVIFNSRLGWRREAVLEQHSERGYNVKNGRSLQVTSLSRTRISVVLDGCNWEMTKHAVR